MSKFDYMNFTGGYSPCEFVAHAKKFTKEQAIEHCIAENDWKFEGDSALRKPTIEDITESYVRWFVRVPDGCGYDGDGGGCYSYCSKDNKGSFPVWVIDFDKLTI